MLTIHAKSTMTITRPMSRLSAGQDFQLGEDFQPAKIVSGRRLCEGCLPYGRGIVGLGRTSHTPATCAVADRHRRGDDQKDRHPLPAVERRRAQQLGICCTYAMGASLCRAESPCAQPEPGWPLSSCCRAGFLLSRPI